MVPRLFHLGSPRRLHLRPHRGAGADPAVDGLRPARGSARLLRPLRGLPAADDRRHVRLEPPTRHRAGGHRVPDDRDRPLAPGHRRQRAVRGLRHPALGAGGALPVFAGRAEAGHGGEFPLASGGQRLHQRRGPDHRHFAAAQALRDPGGQGGASLPHRLPDHRDRAAQDPLADARPRSDGGPADVGAEEDQSEDPERADRRGPLDAAVAIHRTREQRGRAPRRRPRSGDRAPGRGLRREPARPGRGDGRPHRRAPRDEGGGRGARGAFPGGDRDARRRGAARCRGGGAEGTRRRVAPRAARPGPRAGRSRGRPRRVRPRRRDGRRTPRRPLAPEGGQRDLRRRAAADGRRPRGRSDSARPAEDHAARPRLRRHARSAAHGHHHLPAGLHGGHLHRQGHGQPHRPAPRSQPGADRSGDRQLHGRLRGELSGVGVVFPAPR